jgi:hypothetical protein
MIDTNAILSLSLALVSNFCNIVPVDPADVPHRPEDLKKIMIEDLVPPVDVVMWDRLNSQITIRVGVVDRFCSFRSVFEHPEARPGFTGEASLSSNQVVELAARVLSKLAKSGKPLEGTTVRFRRGWYNGHDLPSYRVRFEDPAHYLDPVAEAEIDARNGNFLFVHLYSWDFLDKPFAKRMAEEGHIPTEPPQPQQTRRRLPYPNTNDIPQLVQKWKQFCEKAGMERPTITQISAVDWGKSIVYTNNAVLPDKAISRLTFTNHASFEIVNGVVYQAFSADSFYHGDYERKTGPERAAAEGTVLLPWWDVADEVKKRIVYQFHLDPEKVKHAMPFVRNLAADVGKFGIKRTVIDWRAKAPGEGGYPDQFPWLFSAELDLSTGAIKFLNFPDPKRVGLLDPPVER